MNKKTRKKPPEGGPFRSITMSDEIIPHSASGRGVFLVGPLRGPGSKGSEGRGCGYAAGCVKRLCSLRSGGDSRLQRLRVAVSPDGDEFYSRLLAATLPEAAKTIQPRLTVSRLKGRPFYVQAMGQLRLTCTFSAECAQRVEMHPYPRLWRYFPRRGKFALCLPSRPHRHSEPQAKNLGKNRK